MNNFSSGDKITNIYFFAILPLLRWQRDKGVGSGKVLEPGFELGMPETQLHYM